jgi:hypothetical protein
MLFETNESFKDNKQIWVNDLLKTYCVNNWVCCLDADEIIYKNNLNELRDKMNKQNANICIFYLLDMYSKNIKNKYVRGEPFLTHSNYYDKESDINKSYTDGVRKRTMNVPAYLQKTSFFKYDFFKVCFINDGYHWIEPINVSHHFLIRYRETQILLHFKFIKPDLKEFFKRCVTENQHSNNSIEYNKYLNHPNYNFYDEKFSVCINEVEPNFSFI